MSASNFSKQILLSPAVMSPSTPIATVLKVKTQMGRAMFAKNVVTKRGQMNTPSAEAQTL